MNTPHTLNTRQLSMLLINLLITKFIFTFPRFVFITSGNAAWIEAVFMSLISFVMVNASFMFYHKTGKVSIINLSEFIGGKPLKAIIGLTVAAALCISAASEIRTFAESIKIVLLPGTKTEYIMVLFAIAISVGATLGILPLATINALFLPICLFSVLLLFVTLLGAGDFNNLFPLFGTGKILSGGVKNLSGFSDILVLNLLISKCEDMEVVKKSGRYAITISGTVLVLICIIYGLTYTYPASTEFLLVGYQLSRMVRAGEYFQRFEALFEFIWSITHLLYSSIYVYVISEVFGDSFKLKSPRSTIPVIASALSFLSFLPSSVADALAISGTLKQFTVPISFGLPIIVPILYVHFKKRSEKRL